MGRVDSRLRALALHLPDVPQPIADFVPYTVDGATIFLAGQTCEVDGRIAYSGQVGVDIDLEQAQAAARLCALNLLAALRLACAGELDRVRRCIRVGGFVQAPSGYPSVPVVIDGASNLFVQLWGDAGRHARTAVGVSTLPQNAAVEVDAIFSLSE